jgi:hypothetical protein
LVVVIYRHPQTRRRTGEAAAHKIREDLYFFLWIAAEV